VLTGNTFTLFAYSLIERKKGLFVDVFPKHINNLPNSKDGEQINQQSNPLTSLQVLNQQINESTIHCKKWDKEKNVFMPITLKTQNK